LSPSMLLPGSGGGDEGAALPQLSGVDEIVDAEELRDAV